MAEKRERERKRERKRRRKAGVVAKGAAVAAASAPPGNPGGLPDRLDPPSPATTPAAASSQSQTPQPPTGSQLPPPQVGKAGGASKSSKSSKSSRSSKSSKSSAGPSRLHPTRISALRSASARAYVAAAVQADPHAMHIASFGKCADPACLECLRVARTQAELNSMKTRVLAMHGEGSRVAKLKRGGGTGATPPVQGGGSHSAVAWRLSRRQPRPSVLGPGREGDAEAEGGEGAKGKGKGKDKGKGKEREVVDKRRERLDEARREAQRRGAVMRRMLRAGLGAQADLMHASAGSSSAAGSSRAAGSSTGPTRPRDQPGDATTAVAGPAPVVLDINNLPPPEIDPALEAMDAAGALDLLDLNAPHDSDSVARVSGELEEGAAEGAWPTHEDASEPERAEVELERTVEPGPEPEPEPEPESIDAAVARDFEAVAAARARAKAAAKARADAEIVTLTTSQRAQLGWDSRRRDAQVAANVAQYMAAKAEARARGPVSILKRTAEPTAEPTGADEAEPSTSASASAANTAEPSPSPRPPTRKKSVAFAPTARVYTLPPKRRVALPHPVLYEAVASYAAAFYAETGDMRHPVKATSGRRDTAHEIAKRRELEEGGVWDHEEGGSGGAAGASTSTGKDKGKGKAKDTGKGKGKDKGKGKETGTSTSNDNNNTDGIDGIDDTNHIDGTDGVDVPPKKKYERRGGKYVTRDMEGAFDGTAQLHLAILMEEYMAYLLREAGWRSRSEALADRTALAPSASDLAAMERGSMRVGADADPRRPQRVYFDAEDEGDEEVRVVGGAAAARAGPSAPGTGGMLGRVRMVRFDDGQNKQARGKSKGKGKAKETTPEIPTIVLEDSSDEDGPAPARTQPTPQAVYVESDSSGDASEDKSDDEDACMDVDRDEGMDVDEDEGMGADEDPSSAASADADLAALDDASGAGSDSDSD